jgi:hypothetical protein
MTWLTIQAFVLILLVYVVWSGFLVFYIVRFFRNRANQLSMKEALDMHTLQQLGTHIASNTYVRNTKG